MFTNKPRSLLSTFGDALKSVSPFHANPNEQAELESIREKFAAMKHEMSLDREQETQLFLILENNPPSRSDSPWNRACVITDLVALNAEEKDGKIIVTELLQDVRALDRDMDDESKKAILSLKRGQWVEITGSIGGPLMETFFATATKVRDDLGIVAERNMPRIENDLLLMALAGEVPGQTVFVNNKPQPTAP